MCKAGGFKLSKFTSNNNVVLKSLQEDQIRKGVKDTELSSGELPVERALGVQWNVDEYTFGFKIAAEEKPLTCHGLLSTWSSVDNLLDLDAPFILEGRISSKNYAKKTVLGMNQYQEGQRMNVSSGKKSLRI